MAEMTKRQRMLAATRGEKADKLPWHCTYRYWTPGEIERECRNSCMGIQWERPSSSFKLNGTRVVEEVDRSNPLEFRRTYNTPEGSISLVEKRLPGTGMARGIRGWTGGIAYQTDRAIKKPEDYKVLKYIFENTEFEADYFGIEQAQEWLGEDGIVIDMMRGQGYDYLMHSPMQTLMIEWIGAEGGRFFIQYAKYKDLIEDLYKTICKAFIPMYEIAAKSPAEVVWYPDNVDEVLVNPQLFEKYFVPAYKEAGEIIHKGGKLFAAHFDGRMANLKDLLAQTPLDIIEAFTPPPMGNLHPKDAFEAWPDKVLWMGMPGTVYEMGEQGVKEFMLYLLENVREGSQGYRCMLNLSTENLVSLENMRLVTKIMDQAELPLTEETIDRIRHSIGM